VKLEDLIQHNRDIGFLKDTDWITALEATEAADLIPWIPILPFWHKDPAQHAAARTLLQRLTRLEAAQLAPSVWRDLIRQAHSLSDQALINKLTAKITP
jgi:hypothetical protein